MIRRTTQSPSGCSSVWLTPYADGSRNSDDAAGLRRWRRLTVIRNCGIRDRFSCRGSQP